MTQGVIKMTVYCTSDNKMYKVNDNGKVTELISKRAETYRQNVSEIRKRNEWKQSGSGAAFTGTLRMPDENSESAAYICGLANSPDGRIIYSINLGEVGGLYYKDDNGNWIGFDADLANMVAEKLGIKAEFVEIDWDNKFLELQTGSIDCIWNGMTITDEVKNNSSVTNAYAMNQQIVVTKSQLLVEKFANLKQLKILLKKLFQSLCL